MVQWGLRREVYISDMQTSHCGIECLFPGPNIQVSSSAFIDGKVEEAAMSLRNTVAAEGMMFFNDVEVCQHEGPPMDLQTVYMP